MNNPSLLDWLFDKDNPPNDKGNPSDVKMSSTYLDPKTVSFVSTPATDQQPIHFTTTRTKNDDMILKQAMILVLANWGYNNDNLPDDITISSFQTGKVVKSLLPSFVTSLLSSTTHSKNTNNTKNKSNITPPPFSSHKTDTTCTDQVITNKYVSIGHYESVSSSFGYPPPTTPTLDSSNSTTSTTSRRKVLEQR